MVQLELVVQSLCAGSLIIHETWPCSELQGQPLSWCVKGLLATAVDGASVAAYLQSLPEGHMTASPSSGKPTSRLETQPPEKCDVRSNRVTTGLNAVQRQRAPSKESSKPVPICLTFVCPAATERTMAQTTQEQQHERPARGEWQGGEPQGGFGLGMQRRATVQQYA